MGDDSMIETLYNHLYVPFLRHTFDIYGGYEHIDIYNDLGATSERLVLVYGPEEWGLPKWMILM